MENIINDTLICENFNFFAYQPNYKLTMLRNSLFNKKRFNDLKKFLFEDEMMNVNYQAIKRK